MTMVAPSAGAKIYIGRFSVPLINSLGRLTAAAVAIGCLAILITAASLTPSSDGFGTHLQLGMEKCAWLVRTGLPCPACGMTTSFAWFAHGNLAASFYVQPMGMVLAVLCGVCVWAAGYVALTGRPVYRVLAVVPEKYYLVLLLGMAIIGWGWKMYIHLHGIDGWK